MGADGGKAASTALICSRDIHALIRQLAWIITLILLAAALAIAGSFYLLQARPLAAADALARQRAATDQVLHRIDRLSERIGRLLQMGRDWTEADLLNLDDIASFNRLLVPVLSEYAAIDSLYLARSDGRMFFLQRDGEGWKNRITDVENQGDRQRWLYWSGWETPIREEWRDQAYDPRRRPWYRGVLEVGEGEPHWTPPYLFVSAPVPGMTAALRWTDATSGLTYVFALDLRLVDLAAFVHRLEFGERGQVALLTEDGRLLGPPRRGADREDAGDVDLGPALLKPPSVADYPLLAAVLREAEARIDEVELSAGIAGNDEPWRASLRTLPFGHQSMLLMTLAPSSDFAPLPPRLLTTLLVVLIAIALTAVVAVQTLVRRVRRPIIESVAQIEQTRERAEQETRRRANVASISAQLQQADSPAELGRMLLSQLAGHLPIARGLFCLWDQDRQRLDCVASYAGETTDNAPLPAHEPELEQEPEQAQGQQQEVERNTDAAKPADALPDAPSPSGRGLLLQCARDRQAILLQPPDAGDFGIRSGLGERSPASLLLQPLSHDGRLYAVLELASLGTFSRNDLALLDILEPTMCLMLNRLLQEQATSELLQRTSLNEVRHRLILDSTDEGILGLDTDRRITVVNRVAQEALGYAETLLIGQSMERIHAHVDAAGQAQPERACLIQQALRDGRARQVERDTFLTSDGRALPVRYVVTPLVEQRQVQGAVILFRTRAAGVAR